MPTRRELLEIGALCVAHSVLARATSIVETSPRTLLILGGTGFIGPHLTEQALRAGWRVTHFNRGKRDPDGVSGVETLLGDRNGQLDALRGRKWDVVVDNSGYVPRFVKQSAELLAPNVGHCLFVSSISAYASFAKPNDESSPTGTLANPDVEEVTGETYGPMKALCEQYTRAAFGARASIVRPGYIVGPLDPTDRFTYWPVRAARGGEMLAPGAAADPIQVVDVRDLAQWMLALAGSRAAGNFNAISPPGAFTMGALVAASIEEAAAGASATWVPEEFLAQQLKPEEVDFPPWSPMSGESAGASLSDVTNAARTGLPCRPLRDTVRDTLAWFRTLPAERRAKLRAGLDPAREAELLAAWTRKSATPASS
jgi:2'-hydroxyisoflavone reductase